jgi:L-ascorbate metabolism protein UlaG (beta-lactamase superfamily)
MIVRRLTWSGLEIVAGGVAVVVDLLARTPELSRTAGAPREELIRPLAAPGTVAAAAVTHEHSDHLDIESLLEVVQPDGPVLCPPSIAGRIAAARLQARPVEVWESVTVGTLEFRAVPAVDGLGASQVSWLVRAGDRKVLQCGDTLWHGYWWQIAERCGPIDVVFLPVNAAVVDFDDLQPPSGVPAVMTPEQAAAAAFVLGARRAVPIHYGTFQGESAYVGWPDAGAAFVAEARRRGVDATEIPPGSEIVLSS